MTYAGPTAASNNVSLEDTLALVGALGNIGIQGSAAGTVLRRLFTLTGAEAQKLESIFGVKFANAAGNTRPLVDALADVNAATKDLGTAARAEKFNAAFGLLGITGASAIGRAAGDVRQLRNSLLSVEGVAEKTAATMDSKIGGAFRMAASAAQGVAIAVGEALEPELIQLANSAATVAGHVTKFVSENRELVVTMASGAAGLAVAGAALVTLGTALGVASFALKSFRITAFRTLGVIPGLLLSIRNPARLAIGALLGLAALNRIKAATVEAPHVKQPDAVNAPDVAKLDEIEAPEVKQPDGLQLPVIVQNPESPEAQTQAINQRINPANVPDVPNTEQNIDQRIEPANVPAVEDQTQRIAQKIIEGPVPETGDQTRNNDQRFRRVDVANASDEEPAVERSIKISASQDGLDAVAGQASLAGSELTHLVGTMAGLSVGQAVVGRLGKSLKLIPASGKLAVKSFGLIGGGIKALAAGATAAISGIAGIGSALLAALSSPAAIIGTLAVGATAVAVAAIASSAGMRGELANLARGAMSTFRTIGSQGSRAWARLKATASTSVRGIVSALQSGNIEGAFNVAMAGIKTAWTETLASFAPTWAPIAVSMKRWWGESSKLMKDLFGPAIDSVKTSFGSFLKWFDGPSGMRSMNLTFNDIMGSMAKAYAKTLATMERMKIGAAEVKDDTSTFANDAIDTVNAGANKFWNARMAEMERGYQRLRAFFGKSIGADVNLEVELKNIDTREAAANAAIDAERNRKIGGRDQQQRRAEQQRNTDYDAIANRLDQDLAEIAAETERRNAEDARAVAETEQAANAAAVAAKAALEATIKANAAALPETQEVKKEAAPANDPKTGKSPFGLLKDWKAARDRRDELKSELSGANQNGGVNPETGRTSDQIRPEYHAAREQADRAMAGMERARIEQENNPDRQRDVQEFLTDIALPSSTFDERKAGTLSLAAKTDGEKIKLENNGKGDSVDPKTGQTLQEMIEAARKDVYTAADLNQNAPNVSPNNRTQVREARTGLAQIESRFAGSTGTFSGRAAAQIGGSTNVMSRMAKGIDDAVAVAKQTAANTKAIEAKIDGIVAEGA